MSTATPNAAHARTAPRRDHGQVPHLAPRTPRRDPVGEAIAGKTFVVADLFCGAGGSSEGARRAIAALGGEMLLTAVNHWDKAIASHARNHPRARHYCVSLEVARPQDWVEEGYLDLLMASPECIMHSRARGGRPVNDQRRADAWLVNRWLTNLDVRCLIVENVPEFRQWGPICSLPAGHAGGHSESGRTRTKDACNKPVPAKRGLYFQAWTNSLRELGYAIEFRLCNAADYGDATTRTRFFLIARNDGRPIRWPEPSHSRLGDAGGMFPGLKRWRPAREIIDWSLKGRSIFGRKRPLALNTLLRMRRGIARQRKPLTPYHLRALDKEILRVAAAAGEAAVGKARAALGVPVEPEEIGGPFVISARNSWDGNGTAPGRPRTMDEPVFTLTATTKPELVEPVEEPIEPVLLSRNGHNAADRGSRTASDPLWTITSSDAGTPYLAEPEAMLLAQGGGGEARPAGLPAPTIVSGGAVSVFEPMIAPYYGASDPAEVSLPLSTATTKQRHGLVEPVVMQTGQTGGNGAYVRTADDPLSTVTTAHDHALVDPIVMPAGGREAEARPVGQPIHTLTASDRLSMTEPVVVPRQTFPDPRSVDDPLHTATGSGGGYLAEPVIVPQFGENAGQEPRYHAIDHPLPSVTSHGAGALVLPHIDVHVPAGVDPERLVWIKQTPADPWRLHVLDVRFRMLTNRELARAMGFEDEGRYDFVGTTEEVTMQIGNAVAVNMAKALVLAVLGEA